jgi:hypothetical protein
MYYSLRNRLHLRLTAVGIMLFANLFFIVLSAVNTTVVEWQRILGMGISSIAFIGIFIVSMIISESNSKTLFTSPTNYLITLTPVPAWKKILGHTIPSVLVDVASVGISLFLLLIMTVKLDNGIPGIASTGEALREIFRMADARIVFVFAFVAAWYGIFCVASALWNTLCNTLLRKIPVRKIVATVAVVLVLFALSWINVVLLPFGDGEINRFGPFFAINIINPVFLQFALYVILFQGFIILYATSFLMDRRS